MKQKLDEVRTLAIRLYEAGQKEKRRQPIHVWDDRHQEFCDLSRESVAVWDAIAISAYREFNAT